MGPTTTSGVVFILPKVKVVLMRRKANQILIFLKISRVAPLSKAEDLPGHSKGSTTTSGVVLILPKAKVVWRSRISNLILVFLKNVKCTTSIHT